MGAYQPLKFCDAGFLFFSIERPLAQIVIEHRNEFTRAGLIRKDFDRTSRLRALEWHDGGVVEGQPVKPDIGVEYQPQWRGGGLHGGVSCESWPAAC